MSAQCEMTSDCTFPVAMIEDKGYVYCLTHGINRRDYGYHTRKLRPWELRLIEAGQRVPSYRPISKAEAEVNR